MFCSPEDPCSSCIFLLFGGWSSGGLQPILWPVKLSFRWCEVRSCCLQSQVTEARFRPLWLVWGTLGDLLYSWKWRGTLPPFSRGTGCGIPHWERKLANLPSDYSSSVEPSTRHGTGFPSSGEHRLDRYTMLQSLITQPHIFFHIQCQGWMWRGRSRLHGKLNLAFPQLQVTSSLLRWALLWRLVCIYIHTEAEYTYRNMHAVTLALQ